MAEISKHDDVIDSRDVIERIEELESDIEAMEASKKIEALEEEIEEIEALCPALPETELWKGYEKEKTEIAVRKARIQQLKEEIAKTEEYEELQPLKALAEEAEQYCDDWSFGAILIHEDHFEDYCKELVKDIGDMPRNIPSYIVIDWTATANNLKADYSEIDFDGETFYVR